MKITNLFVVAALLSVGITGCATLNSITSTAGVIENSTIKFAAAEYIAKAGPYGVNNTAGPAQIARAQKVLAIAQQIQGLDTGTVTIATLEATVMADIGKLSPPDQVLATALLQAIVANLGVQVNSGVLGTALTAEINAVMNDVIAACNLYLTPAIATAAKKAS
jgi:hypothetical protein